MIIELNFPEVNGMRLCLFLLLAGLMDAILTNLGIHYGIVEEGNPLMKFVISKSWILFYMIKVFLPLCLVWLFYYRPFKGRTRFLLYTASFLYFSVLAYHLFWILLYLHASI